MMGRRARFTGCAVAACLLAGTAGLAQAAQARTPRVPGILVLSSSHEDLPLHGGTVDSLNWSGYAVTGSNISAATGSFVVPTAGLLPPGFAATWVGIGGYNTTDLIQAGVEEDSLGLTGPQYYPWYEMLPASEVQLSGCTGSVPSCAVNPGDTVTVSLKEVSPNSWNISMVDAGHWSWSKTSSYTSSGSSAEWILEAPQLDGLQTLVSPVGTAAFGPESTFTQGRTSKVLAAGNPTQLDLGLGIINEAVPSAIASDGQSFNVCAYTGTCATPTAGNIKKASSSHQTKSTPAASSHPGSSKTKTR